MTDQLPRYDDIDLSRPAFWEQPFEVREQSFAELRDERPVSYHRTPDGSFLDEKYGRPGFWAVVRHADVATVSQRADLFCSGKGVQVETIPLTRPYRRVMDSMIVMDAPEHSRVRRIIASAFTPKTVRSLHERIRQRATQIVDDILDSRGGDLVLHVAKLPTWTIAEIMGVPSELRKLAYDAADEIVGWNDPRVQAGRGPAQVWTDALDTLIGVSGEIAAARRRNPTDDVMSALVTRSVCGEHLTDDEIAAFFVLLTVAGNDTSRQASCLGLKALSDHPDQRAELAANLDGLLPTTVDEIIRWATPVMSFRRTATKDTELGGRRIEAGDKVAIYYCSANRDPRVFDRPGEFDIHRAPNPHLSFGLGSHYCLGAFLAKTQIGALIREITTRAPRLEIADTTYLGGHFIRGIKRMTYHL